MEQKEIKNINDINREYLEDFISKIRNFFEIIG